MGDNRVAMSVWVVQTPNGTKFWNKREQKFQRNLDKYCTFLTIENANEVASNLGTGYIVKRRTQVTNNKGSWVS